MAKVTTTLGEMDEEALVKTTGVVDDENEHTEWVEYRLPGSDEVIHRSVNMVLKRTDFGNLFATGGTIG